MSALFDKAAMRSVVRARLLVVDADARAAGSALVAAHVLAFFEAQLVSGPVALFASLPFELDTGPLDEALRARSVARVVPRISTGELTFHRLSDDVAAASLPRDRTGIPTPDAALPVVALRDCALVVVPGLAFDDTGSRLGHGRGYYDRALAPLHDVTQVGVLLDVQRVAHVPVDAHDVALRYTCSPAHGVVEHGVHASRARGR